MNPPGAFEQSLNWFTDHHFTIWPLSLLRPPVNVRFGAPRVLVLGILTATLVVVAVTVLRWITGREIDAFATIGISIIALLWSWTWFALAALAWNGRARRLGIETERRV